MKLIVIPIEIPDREFEAKIGIFARFLVNRGYTVVFGDQNYLIKLFPYFKNSLLFWKNINCSKTPSVMEFAKYNNYVLHHEEGFVDWHDDVIQNVDKKLFEHASFVFTWGEYQKRVYDDVFKHLPSKTINVGHPRLDLSKLYGKNFKTNTRVRKILINSRFANINHTYGVEYYQSSLTRYIGNSDLAKRIVDQAYRDFAIFKEIILFLDKKPELDIVIRPHPSEDAHILRQRLGKLHNCRFESGGDINHAIEKADLVIANQCHTQFEAALHGKSVLVVRDPNADRATLAPWIDEISGPLIGSASETEPFLEKVPEPTIQRLLLQQEATICNQKLLTDSDEYGSSRRIEEIVKHLMPASSFSPSLILCWYLSILSILNKIRKFLFNKNAEYYNRYPSEKIKLALSEFLVTDVVYGRVWIMSQKDATKSGKKSFKQHTAF